MPEPKTPLQGTYVIGTFRGVTDDQYPRLLVGTFVRPDGSEFQQQLQFSAFDPRTGERMLPDGLVPGARVAVRVRLDAKGYTDKTTGQPATFVAKQALEVTAL